MGLLDGEPPNLARFVFTDARARAAYPEWDRVADEHVASLRIDAGLGDDPHVAGLAEELTILAGRAFTARLEAPPALPRLTGVERWCIPPSAS